MSDVVTVVGDASVKDLEGLRAVMDELSSTAQADEPGTLLYEWYLSEDGTTAWFLERYADSAAMLHHLGHFGERAEAFLAAADLGTINVLGNPSVEVREAFAAFAPAVHSLQGSIHR